MQIDAQIFRACDIRGIVDISLTEEVVFAIGRALGTKVLATHGSSIVIGRDGRLSGARLLQQLAAGIQAAGCDVVDVGLVPTPCLYFAAFALDITSAVMLTGSHNPPNYNGLKIILNGVTIHGVAIQELLTIIQQQNFATGNGSYAQTNIIDKYINAITQDVKVPRKLKVVVDCGNGAAGAVAPEVYGKLQCEVIPLYCDIDGNFPNHHPDPSDLQNLSALINAVHTHNADFGLAFDGDGDRLGIIDNNGKVIWPDRLLILFAQELLKTKPNATIIYDVKCSTDVAKVIRANGGTPLMWNTGHSLIKAKMQETGALLAGEMSGHVFFKDRWFGFDDAIYTGARLIEILSHISATAAEIFAKLPEMVSTPELQVAVTENSKFTIMQDLLQTAVFSTPNEKITIDGLRVEFADGWGLVRPSNTTPKLVIRFEALNGDALRRIQQQFRQALLQVAPYLELPF
jgi:phosphomannomutase/phosphoglucomutase